MIPHADIKLFRAEAQEAGLELLDVENRGSGHYCCTYRRSDGFVFKHFCPKTTSDHRSAKNRLARLKRVARGISNMFHRGDHEVPNVQGKVGRA